MKYIRLSIIISYVFLYYFIIYFLELMNYNK